jgi:hypothetical protein
MIFTPKRKECVTMQFRVVSFTFGRIEMHVEGHHNTLVQAQRHAQELELAGLCTMVQEANCAQPD